MSETNNMPEKQKEYSIETDPLFKPISEHKKKQIDEAVKKQVASLSLDENVDKDEMKVSGQNYALISLVSPQSNQKNDSCCIKIRGVFNTLDDANKRAEMVQKIDSTFDVYVVEMYSWLLVPPDPELIEQKHIDSKLNEIIGGHRESQLSAKMHFEERKRDLMSNINIENDTVTPDINLIGAESGLDITDITDGKNCPNSGPNSEESTPNELMDAMINQIPVEKPSKSWADSL